MEKGTVLAHLLAGAIQVWSHPYAVNIMHGCYQLRQVQFDSAHLAKRAARRSAQGALDTAATHFMTDLVKILLQIGFSVHGPALRVLRLDARSG
jgi:hypothetical protein